ncbi:YdeI/OmpD-associated family protein [Mucilaginibacter gynuensis]|uniref:YdeI/OmpD-associated family protein n=1 Tax=Mucilaginibacter gynuensis TaxID=1302236 RepID=A0ABP8G7Z9_9SPHI
MNALAKKLQIKAGSRWLLFNAPENFAVMLDGLPVDTQLVFTADAAVNGILLFATNSAELIPSLNEIQSLLKPETYLWLVYPKKSGKINSDLEMMKDWSMFTNRNLRPVASAAVNDDWTALRFKPNELVKDSESSRASIGKNNEFAGYIFPEKKLVILPADVQEALTAEPTALAYYETLAYSHKKEYIVWILSAKQEKTRADRLVKMIDKLLGNKKNPAEK